MNKIFKPLTITTVALLLVVTTGCSTTTPTASHTVEPIVTVHGSAGVLAPEPIVTVSGSAGILADDPISE